MDSNASKTFIYAEWLKARGQRFLLGSSKTLANEPNIAEKYFFLLTKESIENIQAREMLRKIVAALKIEDSDWISLAQESFQETLNNFHPKMVFSFTLDFNQPQKSNLKSFNDKQVWMHESYDLEAMVKFPEHKKEAWVFLKGLSLQENTN